LLPALPDRHGGGSGSRRVELVPAREAVDAVPTHVRWQGATNVTDHTEASTDAHPNSTEGGDSAAWPNASDHLPVPVAVLVGIALVAGVIGRFVVDSPLWLDEALSVNIAS